MKADAQCALATIRRCLAAERFRLSEHFTKRMDDRGLMWADVLSVFDDPARADADGYDHAARSRWIIRGPSTDRTAVGIVCAIGRDGRGELTVFITLFWER